MNLLPTRDQARGILILHCVQVANNSDGLAIVDAYVAGDLMTYDEWEAQAQVENRRRSLSDVPPLFQL